MADHSSIEWTEASWSVVVGCEHVSPGCDRCYAAKLTSGRLRWRPEYAGLAHDGVFTGEVRLLPERLYWPVKWRKPRRVFVCSMSDLFHADVPDEFVARVFAVMALTPQHTYQVLTKRHARMRSLLSAERFKTSVAELAMEMAEARPGPPHVPMDLVIPPEGRSWWPLTNVWCGVSVEDQQWADIRIPALLDTPAVVRWVSAEPLLGPVDLGRWLYLTSPSTAGPFRDWRGERRATDGRGRYLGGGGIGGHVFTSIPSFDLNWLVVGGESGPGARPMDLDWVRRLVEQCAGAGVPPFVKQLGSRWGRDHHDISEFPPDLQVREYPLAPAAAGEVSR